MTIACDRHLKVHIGPSGFLCLNDKMIKELIYLLSFEQKKCLVILLRIFMYQDIQCFLELNVVQHVCHMAKCECNKQAIWQGGE
jgi:hypothetical protein